VPPPASICASKDVPLALAGCTFAHLGIDGTKDDLDRPSWKSLVWVNGTASFVGCSFTSNTAMAPGHSFILADTAVDVSALRFEECTFWGDSKEHLLSLPATGNSTVYGDNATLAVWPSRLTREGVKVQPLTAVPSTAAFLAAEDPWLLATQEVRHAAPIAFR
jgi:hypothetical protein